VLDTAIQVDPETGQASVELGLLTALVAGMVAVPIVTGVLGVWQTLLTWSALQSRR
jgi:Flp pilus assembly pilin Flp